MDKLEEIIYKNTREGMSMFLIGQTNSGKTWFIEHILIPYLDKMGVSVQYFKNAEEIAGVKSKTDLIIIDELETFQDARHLEQNHPNEKSYYQTSYIKRVENWFSVLKNIKNICLYVISRNNKEDINFLANSCQFADWDNRKIVTLVFSKDRCF